MNNNYNGQRGKKRSENDSNKFPWFIISKKFQSEIDKTMKGRDWNDAAPEAA